APTQVPIDELANAAEAEKWEGVLVSTGQVTVMTPFNTASSTFEVGQPGIPLRIAVGNTMFQFPPALDGRLTVGDTFRNVRGPLNYAFDTFRIEPRNMPDLDGYSDN